MPYNKQPKVQSPDEWWVNIPCFQGDYSVSTKGRIYSERFHRFLSPYINRWGYQSITIRNKHFMVHQLVAYSFLGVRPGVSMEVNHIDGNKLNNTISNLEIVTHSENMKHAWRTGLIRPEMFIPEGHSIKDDNPVISRLYSFLRNEMNMSLSDFERATSISRKIFTAHSKTIQKRTIKKIVDNLPIDKEWLING